MSEGRPFAHNPRSTPTGAISVATALIINAAKPPELQQTYAQIAQELGVIPTTVSECASRLRTKGRLPRLPGHRVPPPPPPVLPQSPPVARDLNAPPTPEETRLWNNQTALAKAAGGDFSDVNVLNSDERKRGLSYLAQTAPPAVQVQAHKALEEMERAQGTVVGPPPPQSDEELSTRLAALLEAAGPTLSFAAMKAAFPEVAK